MIDRKLNGVITKIQKRFGRKKPFALSVDGWEEFYAKYKEEEPKQYFWCETVPDGILWGYRRVFGWKIRKLSEFLRYRLYDKNHIVKTDLEPGYYDKDTILFHANFTILVDFVESELAWFNMITRDFKDGSVISEKYSRKNFILEYFDPFGIYRSSFRSRELGKDYLSKQIDYNPYDIEDDESVIDSLFLQIDKYKKILDIYTWYTKTRPQRYEDDLSSIIDDRGYYEKEYGIMFIMSDRFKEDHPETYKRYMDSLKDKNLLEKQYDEEDTEMLKQLIDIRHSLWT